MYDKRKGSMAPFSFRLLLADLPAHLGLPKLALDRLTHLATVCAGIKKYYAPQNKEAFDFWQTRENLVLQYIINCSILVKRCLRKNASKCYCLLFCSYYR